MTGVATRPHPFPCTRPTLLCQIKQYLIWAKLLNQLPLREQQVPVHCITPLKIEVLPIPFAASFNVLYITAPFSSHRWGCGKDWGRNYWQWAATLALLHHPQTVYCSVCVRAFFCRSHISIVLNGNATNSMASTETAFLWYRIKKFHMHYRHA